MRRRLGELFGEGLALRIGVNTGEVVVGKPREGSSFVTGDAVNVAARLEQAAEPGEILAGERTVAAARGAFEFDEPRTIEAKGKPEGVECRRLVRALSLMRPRGVGGLRPSSSAARRARARSSATTRVGRPAASRSSSRSSAMRASARRGSCASSGSASARRAPEPLRRTGRCLSYGQGITYWALGEMLKEHFGILESDPPERSYGRLGEREMLGLRARPRRRSRLHPLAARDRFQDAWVEFLGELVGERPGRDADRGRPLGRGPAARSARAHSSATRGAAAPARDRAAGAARPQRPGWGARVRGATRCARAALARGRGSACSTSCSGARCRPGCATSSSNARRATRSSSRSYSATLIDRQLLERQNGSWRLAQLPPDFAVPDTVHAVVAARIDLLEPGGEGRRSRPPPSIGRDLLGTARLRARRRCASRTWGSSRSATSSAAAPARRSPGDREYAIKHALTREVAYASLPTARRARMHAALARLARAPGTGATSTRRSSPTTTREAVRPGRRRPRLGGPRRPSSQSCEHGRSPGSPRRRARDRHASRSTTGSRCSTVRSSSSLTDGGAGGALARDRARQRPQAGRRGVLGGDAAGSLEGCDDSGDRRRHVQRARVPHRDARDVEAAAGPRAASNGVDRTSARALRARHGRRGQRPSSRAPHGIRGVRRPRPWRRASSPSRSADGSSCGPGRGKPARGKPRARGTTRRR